MAGWQGGMWDGMQGEVGSINQMVSRRYLLSGRAGWQARGGLAGKRWFVCTVLSRYSVLAYLSNL